MGFILKSGLCAIALVFAYSAVIPNTSTYATEANADSAAATATATGVDQGINAYRGGVQTDDAASTTENEALSATGFSQDELDLSLIHI